jgi:hypothetical protein
MARRQRSGDQVGRSADHRPRRCMQSGSEPLGKNLRCRPPHAGGSDDRIRRQGRGHAGPHCHGALGAAARARQSLRMADCCLFNVPCPNAAERLKGRLDTSWGPQLVYPDRRSACAAVCNRRSACARRVRPLEDIGTNLFKFELNSAVAGFCQSFAIVGRRKRSRRALNSKANLHGF